MATKRPAAAAGVAQAPAVEPAPPAAAAAVPTTSNWAALRAKLDCSKRRAPQPAAPAKRHRPPAADAEAAAAQHALALPSFTHHHHHPAAAAAEASRPSFAQQQQQQHEQPPTAAAVAALGAVHPSAGAVSFAALAQLLPAQAPALGGAGRRTGGSGAAAAATAAGGSSPQALAAVLGPFEGLQLSQEERRYVALDCEMVGVGADGARSVLAQVVLVDWAGRVLYMRYVRAQEPVTDYRTHVSGIRPEHLAPSSALDFATVQREVAALLQGKILVGHGLDNDLQCLMLGHPWRAIRDTAKYRPFCWLNKEGRFKPRRLKQLVQTRLGGLVIQEGEHEPAEDARAALALYRGVRIEWEAEMAGVPLPGQMAAAKERKRAAKAARRSGGGGGGGGGAAREGRGADEPPGKRAKRNF